MVDWKYWQFLIRNNVKLVFIGHLCFLHFAIQIIVSNFLCIKVEKTDLSLWLDFVLIAKYWVDFFCLADFRKCHSNNTIERIQFYWVKSIGADDLSFFNLLFLILHKWAPPENVFFQLLLRAFTLFQQNESDSVIIADDGWIDIDFVLKLENSFFSDFAVLFQIIDLHFVVFFNMVLIFFFPAGCGFEQKANLSFIDFNDSLDFFRWEMIDGALFRFFPTKNVVCLCADGIWLIIEVKIQFLEFVFLWGFKRHRSRVFLQFPLFESQIGESENFVFNFRIEYDFVKVFAFVDDLCDFFSPILTDDMNAAVVYFGIPFIINILKFSDGVGPWILFLMSLERINFNHLVGALPENINPWIFVDWHDYAKLEFLLVALFISGKLQTRDFVGLGYLPIFAYLPRVKQFDFLLLKVRS